MSIVSNSLSHFLRGLEQELLAPNLSLNKLEEPTQIFAGLNIYTAFDVELFRILDVCTRDYFMNEFRAKHILAPSLIPLSYLMDTGYLKNSLHNLNLVKQFNKSSLQYKKWETGEECLCFDHLDSLPHNPTSLGLNTALCHHVYPILKESTLEVDEVIAITLSGTCFRDEGKMHNQSYRLLEFRMRECVFFGNHNDIMLIQNKLLSFLKSFAFIFDLKSNLVPATDLFFGYRSAEKSDFQRKFASKIEVQVQTSETEKAIAIASVNRHGSHFSKQYTISLADGSLASSLCVGLGFDRIVKLIHSALLKNGSTYLDKCIERIGQLTLVEAANEL